MPTDVNTQKPLTVLQVLPALKVGGVERGTIEFAVYLKQQGHRPIVVSAGGQLVEVLQSHQIKHIVLAVGKKSLCALQLPKRLKKIINENQVDIVHARSRLPAWLCNCAIKKIKINNRPKFVTTLHGLHSVNWYSSIMARGDAVIAVSNTAKKYLESNFAKDLKNAPTLIYRGVDEAFSKTIEPADIQWLNTYKAKLPANSTAKTVLMAGRLTALKGAEHLIHWLQNTEHTAFLLLTATPDQSNYSLKLQQLFEKNGVIDQVVWLGYESNMVELYTAVDLVVSVNKKPESFGRTVLEALTVGTPVVAFSHGGVEEILVELYPTGQVKPFDEVVLAEKIDEFLTAAPEVPEHNQFTNTEMFERTLMVYRQLMVQHHVT